MNYITRTLLIGLLFALISYVSVMEYNEMELAENEYPKDKDNDGIHDYECECGDCFEELYTDTLKLRQWEGTKDKAL